MGDTFLNKSPFSGKSVCWVLDSSLGEGLPLGGQISLLSRASLSVGFLICFLGEGLPVGGQFS